MHHYYSTVYQISHDHSLVVTITVTC